MGFYMKFRLTYCNNRSLTFIVELITAMYVFIRKSHQHAGIKRLSFFVVAVVTAMGVYMKMKCSSSLSRAPPPDG